jgi:hypothetical protein
MVFVLLTDENTLEIHEDEPSAIRSCEGVDVEDGVCLFFDDSGQPLNPVFDTPNKRIGPFVSSGHYRLRLAEPGRAILLELLPKVVNVEGPPLLRSVADVERLLTSRSSGTPSGAPHR